MQGDPQDVADKVPEVGGQADVQQPEQGGEVVDVGARRQGEHLGDNGGQQQGDAAVGRHRPGFAEEEPVHFQEGEVPHVDIPATQGTDHRDEAPEPTGAPDLTVSLVVVEDHTGEAT